MSNFIRRVLCYWHIYRGKKIVKLLFRKYVKDIIGRLWLFFWLNITRTTFSNLYKIRATTSLMWSIQGCYLNCKEFKVTRILKLEEGWNFKRAWSEQNMDLFFSSFGGRNKINVSQTESVFFYGNKTFDKSQVYYDDDAACEIFNYDGDQIVIGFSEISIPRTSPWSKETGIDL